MTSNHSLTKDRLKQLYQVQNESNSNDANNSVDETKINFENKNDHSPELRQVFEKVQVIRVWIGTIEENTKVIQDLTKNNLTSKKLIHSEIESRVKNTTSIAYKITNKLKELDVKYTNNPEKDKSALKRITRIQYAMLRQEFQKAMYENNDVLEKYKERQKMLLQKQATLVNSALTEEELEAMIDNPNGGQFFTDNILLDTQHAKDQLAMIEERHAELLKIEKLLEEVRDQFLQMAILVEQQKVHIDRIEFHASDAIDYVDRGLLDIEAAVRNKKRARKWTYIIIIFVLIFIILILLMLLLN